LKDEVGIRQVVIVKEGQIKGSGSQTRKKIWVQDGVSSEVCHGRSLVEEETRGRADQTIKPNQWKENHLAKGWIPIRKTQTQVLFDPKKRMSVQY